MLFTFLFLVFFSFYVWLYYKPSHNSSQHRRYGSAALAAATSSQTTPKARIPNAEAPPLTAKLQLNEDKPTVQTVDKRTPIPEQSLLNLDADIELKPALTEEEAIALAVETTLAKDAMKVSSGELEDIVPELMRPKPPEPELVEAAVRDAEEKFEDFSPPEIVDGESQVGDGLKRKIV